MAAGDHLSQDQFVDLDALRKHLREEHGVMGVAGEHRAVLRSIHKNVHEREAAKKE